MFGLVATVAGSQASWVFGIAAGTILMALVHVSLLVKFLVERGFKEVDFIGELPVAMVICLNLCTLAWNWSPYSKNSALDSTRAKAHLRRAAWLSLTGICVMACVSLWPGRYVSPGRDEATRQVACLLFFLSVLPWLAVWRRRQMSGYVYPKAGPDGLAKSLMMFAVPLAISSMVPAALVLASSRQGTNDWTAINIALICVLISFAGHVMGSVMIVLSFAIQWYRNRWFLLLNGLALCYTAVLAGLYLAYCDRL